jgi:hypothetical protein
VASRSSGEKVAQSPTLAEPSPVFHKDTFSKSRRRFANLPDLTAAYDGDVTVVVQIERITIKGTTAGLVDTFGHKARSPQGDFRVRRAF